MGTIFLLLFNRVVGWDLLGILCWPLVYSGTHTVTICYSNKKDLGLWHY